MSKCVNKIILIGHAGADPDVRTAPSGNRVAKLSLATNDGYGDTERTNWHRLVAFGKLVDVVEKHVRKGDRLYIEGRMDYGSYEKDGVTIPTADVVIREMVMLGSKDGPREPAPAPDAGSPWDEDAPF